MADQLSSAAQSIGLGTTPETDEDRRKRLLQQQQRLVPGMSSSYGIALSPAGMSLGLGQSQ